MITVILNGRAIETYSSTLAELLHEQHFDIGCVASALNGQFVPRTEYKTRQLSEGNQLEVLSPMQGG